MTEITYNDLKAKKSTLEGRTQFTYPDKRPATFHEVDISKAFVGAAPLHDESWWQRQQIRWQEECDVIFRQFDNDVAAHFPQHLGPNCSNCPTPPPMPEKPKPPFERG